MKKIIITLLFFLAVLIVCAQQVVIVNHSFLKPVVYNPAFTGSGEGTNLLLINHTQWSGFKNAPRYSMFSFDKNYNKMGLGINLISDKKGLNNKLGGNLLYAYKININENARLALGISAGIFQQSLNYSGAVIENSADATLLSGTQTETTYDGNAGLAFLS